MLLETYTTVSHEELVRKLPPFLAIQKEVTGMPEYSMYNLSLKRDWQDGAIENEFEEQVISDSGSFEDLCPTRSVREQLKQLRISPEKEKANIRANEFDDKFDEDMDKKYNANYLDSVN